MTVDHTDGSKKLLSPKYDDYKSTSLRVKYATMN